MKLKRILAGLLAVQMVLTSAVAVRAEEETSFQAQTEAAENLVSGNTGGGVFLAMPKMMKQSRRPSLSKKQRFQVRKMKQR